MATKAPAKAAAAGKKPAKSKAKPKRKRAAAPKKPSASPKVQAVKDAVRKLPNRVTVVKAASTKLGVSASEAIPRGDLTSNGGYAPARPLKPIEVELARRAHFDDLYHRLVKPAPKGKKGGD